MKGQRDRKDYIDLTGLPNRALVKKARKIIAQIKSGVHYQDLGGKKIKCSKNVVSIPLSRRYRILCVNEGDRLIAKRVLSHEDYNKFNFTSLDAIAQW
jgi:hypothetical protein